MEFGNAGETPVQQRSVVGELERKVVQKPVDHRVEPGWGKRVTIHDCGLAAYNEMFRSRGCRHSCSALRMTRAILWTASSMLRT